MNSVYWTSTTAIALFFLWSAYTYLFSTSTIEGVRALGFPDFFRIQLAVLKVIAVVVLLLPYFPLYLKEWAYAGVGLFFITAIVAHAAHKDPPVINLINLVLIGVLVTSYIYLKKMF